MSSALWTPSLSCPGFYSHVELSLSLRRCPAHPTLAHYSSPTPSTPSLTVWLPNGFRPKWRRKKSMLRFFFFSSSVIPMCSEGWQPWGTSSVSVRVRAIQSAEGFKKSVGSGVQAAGARGKVPRPQRWRNSSSRHFFFSFFSLEHHGSPPCSFNKCQYGPPPPSPPLQSLIPLVCFF